MIELGRVSEKVDDALDEAAQHRVVGLEAVQLDALRSAHRAHQLRWGVLFELQTTEQRCGDRRPDVRLPVRRTGPAEDRDGSTRERVERFGDQPRLSGSGLPGDGHDRAAAVGHHRHDRRQQLPLRRSPHERHVVEPCTDSRDTPTTARDAPDPLGLFTSTDLEVVDRLAQDLLRCERRRRVTDQNASRLRQCLQPRRDVDHIARRGVLRGTRDVADDHLTRIDPDPQLQRTVEIGLISHESSEGFMHLHRGSDGTVGIVLVGDRRAEQGQDAVAHHLVDSAAERRDVGDQPLEARVDQALHPLGIEMLGQRCVADEIGEDHGDHSTLLGDGGPDLVTTRWAEPCAIGKRGVTRRTGGHQPGSYDTSTHRRTTVTRLESPRDTIAPDRADAESAIRPTPVRRRADAARSDRR